MRRGYTRGDGTGPELPLGERIIYWDPIEAPRRQQSLHRTRSMELPHAAAAPTQGG